MNRIVKKVNMEGRDYIVVLKPSSYATDLVEAKVYNADKKWYSLPIHDELYSYVQCKGDFKIMIEDTMKRFYAFKIEPFKNINEKHESLEAWDGTISL